MPLRWRREAKIGNNSPHVVQLSCFSPKMILRWSLQTLSFWCGTALLHFSDGASQNCFTNTRRWRLLGRCRCRCSIAVLYCFLLEQTSYGALCTWLLLVSCRCSCLFYYHNWWGGGVLDSHNPVYSINWILIFEIVHADHWASHFWKF